MIVLAAFAVAVPGSAAPLSSGSPTLRRHVPPVRPGFRFPYDRRLGMHDGVDRHTILPNGPHLLLPSRPPDIVLVPRGPGPSLPIGGQPGSLPAFAHGFHLSVTVGTGQTFAVPATLDRFIEVGQALGACFAPPAGLNWGSVTLRVSFKRDGSVFGLPRVPFSDAASANQKSDLAQSLLAGLKRCTPLALSPSLGAAVAGEIFAIRFIHQDKR